MRTVGLTEPNPKPQTKAAQTKTAKKPKKSGENHNA